MKYSELAKLVHEFAGPVSIEVLSPDREAVYLEIVKDSFVRVWTNHPKADMESGLEFQVTGFGDAVLTVVDSMNPSI